MTNPQLDLDALAKRWREHAVRVDQPDLLALLDDRDALKARAEHAESFCYRAASVGGDAFVCAETVPLRAEIAALRATVEKLRRALGPLAELARHGDRHRPDASDNEEIGVSVGVLRRARAALEETRP